MDTVTLPREEYELLKKKAEITRVRFSFHL